MSARISIDDQHYLSPPQESDIPAMLLHLADKSVYEGTLAVPFPYSEKDARGYLENCEQKHKQFGHYTNFAIRNAAGELIGGIAFHGKNLHPTIAHKDEIGYWLAKSYRGKGIMTNAILALVKYGEEVRGLKRFEAPIFSYNTASERVLLRCGFKEEGLIPKAYFKEGKFIDGRMFALVK